eukprot:gnl/TRDRNA2_/TRDRNA2_191110_c0_seq1.p1 gnl/TRDRNA2_/TRDRNA2_191110_c0~~gnl/TRDRNA2_/TRDRNA2_191110_c0_seq1.p1  ORF type:complete len:179 (-),score=19.54 gnl/TRDRNA2_/TRDRNA2_191110_c0_seq1:77-547(-)
MARIDYSSFHAFGQQIGKEEAQAEQFERLQARITRTRAHVKKKEEAKLKGQSAPQQISRGIMEADRPRSGGSMPGGYNGSRSSPSLAMAGAALAGGDDGDMCSCVSSCRPSASVLEAASAVSRVAPSSVASMRPEFWPGSLRRSKQYSSQRVSWAP